MVTVASALSYAGIDRLDAEVLLSHLLGCERLDLLVNRHNPVPPEVLKAFSVLVKRRAEGEPVAYIIGEKEFMSLAFKVDKNVLIPRPETEILPEIAIEFAKGKGTVRVLDICTGSGCIAVSAAYYAENILADGVDISEKALSVAGENAKRHGVAPRARFYPMDVLNEEIGGMYDVILSNPPYIPSDEMSSLDITVKDYEPRLALDGGADGLTFYRTIIPKAALALNPGGLLAVEIDPRQSADVMDIMKENSLKRVSIKKDLAGLDRVAIGYR